MMPRTLQPPGRASRFPVHTTGGFTRMQKTMRWSATLAMLLLVLVACQGNGGSSAEESASGAGGDDPEAVCAADAVGCVEVAEGDTLKIASALAITGDVAFLGNDSNYGIQIAIDDRDGELLGHEIELVKEDSGCGDAATGQTAAQAIVADPQIVSVIGTTCSRTAVPAMPVLEEAGLIMISPSNTAPSLTNPDTEDYGGEFYFRTAYNDEVQGAAVAKFACEELGVTTAATIHDGSPYAEQLQQVFVDQFAEQCDGETTSQQAINVGDVQFGDVLESIAADEPELLYFPVFDPEGPLITQQAQDVAGLENTILFGSDGVKDEGFLTTAGDIAEEVGMYFSGPDLNFGGAYEDDFLPKYQDLSGEDGPIAPYHAHAYDAANIIFDAIESVAMEGDDGTLFIPKDGIRQYVEGLTDYAGLTGTLTCDENGDCGAEDVSVAQVVDGEFSEVWTTRDQ
jgi:branched-chain amino acid transport system substrate-binding protein